MSGSEKERSKDILLKKMESRRIATCKQIDCLIDFLRDNDELRYGRVRSKQAIYMIRQLWDLCTEKLNKLGPSRTSKEWAKYWSDMKCRVKQKVVEKNKRSSSAGEGRSASPAFTYVEKRIIGLLEHDGQLKPTVEAPLDSSGGSSLESINFALVKEEKEEVNTDDQEMNVEDFITTAPIVEDLVASDKLPTSQPPLNLSRSASVSLPGPIPQPSSLQPSSIEATQPKMQLSPTNLGPSLDRPQSVPPGMPTSSKRRRRRPRVLQSRPSQSCMNPECIKCIELKEFAEVILKLEESHARTTKLQTEASLKMTELLKLQAEGILHTGVALREMANNLCRLLEGQIYPNRRVMT